MQAGNRTRRTVTNKGICPMVVRSLALAFILAGTVAASAATDDELRQQIVGKWGETAECADSTLSFNADGTFGDGDRTGTYSITGGKLSGKAGEQAMPDVTVSFDADKMMLKNEGGDTDTLTKCK
jgi:hypothetical protein